MSGIQIGPAGDAAADADVFEDAYGVAPDGAIIARPDGIVAWRASQTDLDAEQSIEAAMNRLLCRV
ncbi:MAG: hypothetical protein ABI170_03835 [Microbacteriaceae bacterium]